MTRIEPGGVVTVRFANDGSERKLMLEYAPLEKIDMVIKVDGCYGGWFGGAEPCLLRFGVRGKDPACLLELGVRGREGLVGPVELVRVDAPLAVVPHQPCHERGAAVARLVVVVDVRPVDRLGADRARMRDDLRHHPVPLMSGIALVDHADVELRHAQCGGVVAGAEDDRLGARTRPRDLAQVDGPCRGLDLQLEANAAAEAEVALQAAEQVIGEMHM